MEVLLFPLFLPSLKEPFVKMISVSPIEVWGAMVGYVRILRDATMEKL